MDVLLIDCNSVRAEEQKKAYELSKFHNIRLSLLVPSYYVENLKKNKVEKTFDSNYRISIGTFFGKHPNRAIFLNKLLKEVLKKPDIICVHSDENFFLTFQTLLFKLLFSPKSKFIFHTWQNIHFNGEIYPQANKFLYYIDNLIEKFVLKFSDACITRNMEGLTIMNKKGFKGALTYIPWGTDIDNFYKRDVTTLRLKYELNGFVIGYIGRLVEEKGILDLIKAVRHIKENYTLLIVGNGPLKERIRVVAEEERINNNLRLFGGVPFKDVPVIMDCIDTLVLPSKTTSKSKWKEQFGRVLIEAMACEVPVIGSNSGAIPEVIGDAGLIFREGDVKDLASKLEVLMKNHKVRQELKEKGKQRVLDHFTWQKFAEKNYNFFDEILAKRKN